MELNKNDKNKLYGFFHNINPEELHRTNKQKTNSVVLIIDGTNSYLRCYSASPELNSNGEHVGGIVGFLKSIVYAIKLLSPSRCCIIFDGEGGSARRRKMYPEYKMGRKGKIRLNRSYDELETSDSEEKSCILQYIKLLNYLQVLPINILSQNSVEADDLIANIALDYFKEANKVYIMSTDKDFLQLCSDKVNIYSPTKKKIYGPAEMVSEYKIHPNNFVLNRAIQGDTSDNIDGIYGAGEKTIIKHFPWLIEEKCYTVDDIVNAASKLRDKYKVCNAIVEGRAIIERNIELMQLRETILSTTAQLYCYDCLEESKIPMLNKNVFFNLIRNDGLSNNIPNHVSWISENFAYLNNVVRGD